jgi:acetyl-CoA carboxylase alpha subunit
VAWAAEALKITAADLLALEVIDGVIPEPPGGAHRHPDAAIAAVGDVLEQQLKELITLPVEKLMEQRYTKFRRMGSVAIVEGKDRRSGK